MRSIILCLALVGCGIGFVSAGPSAAASLRMPLQVLAERVDKIDPGPNHIGPAHAPSSLLIGAPPAKSESLFPNSNVQVQPDRLPPGNAQDRSQARVADDVLLDKLDHGVAALRAAESDQPVLLLLTGPPVGDQNAWKPVSVERENLSITLTVEAWNQPEASSAGVSCHPVYLVSLGALPAAKYHFTLRIRRFDRIANSPDRTEAYYRLARVTAGSVDFAVKEPAAQSAPEVANAFSESVSCIGPSQATLYAIREAAPAVLNPASIKDDPLPSDAAGALFQQPLSTQYMGEAFSPATGQSTSGIRAPGLYVGTFDLAKWQAKVGAGTVKAMDLPVLAQPVGLAPVYAVVVGPDTSVGGTMTLRSVEWKGGSAVLHVEMWYYPEVLDQAGVEPILIVPLVAKPGAGTGPISVLCPIESVRVEWNNLMGLAPGLFISKPEPVLPDSRSRVDRKGFGTPAAVLDW